MVGDIVRLLAIPADDVICGGLLLADSFPEPADFEAVHVPLRGDSFERPTI